MSSDARLSSVTDMAVDRPLILFFTLAYAISWLGFLPMILWHWPIQFIIVASCGPSVAALITHRLATGSYRAFRVYSTVPRTLFSTVVGVVLVVLAYVVLPGVISADPRQLHWSILTSVTVYNYSTLLGGPLGEEPGWRGYALPRLEANLGPIRASLLLALLWAGWHLPLFFIPGWSSSPLWIYLLIALGLCVIMTFGVNLARFSTVTAIAMHAAFNTVSRFLNGLFTGAQPRASIPFERVLAISGLATALVLIVVTRGHLAYHQDPDRP